MADKLQWRLKGTNSTFTTSKLISLPCTVQTARCKLKEECGLQNVSAIDFVIYLATDEFRVLPDSYMLRESCRVLVTRCSSSEAAKLLSLAEETFPTEPSEGGTSLSISNDGTSVAKVNGSSSARITSSHYTGASSGITTATTTANDHGGGGVGRSVSKDENGVVKVEARNGVDVKSNSTSSDGHYTRSDSEKIGGDYQLHHDKDGYPGMHSPDEEFESAHSNDDDGSYDSESGDEDSRIQAAMQERDFFGGEAQDSLTRRYYRNRTASHGTGGGGGGGPSSSDHDSGQRTTGATIVAERPQYGPGMYTAPRTVFIEPVVQEIVPVDSNYICHMCGQRGHHIRNCVQPEGKRIHKKIRPATGIPVDFLDVISEDDIGKYEEVYQLKTGQFAVMKDMSKVSGGAFFTKSADQRIQSQLGISESGSKSMVRGLRCNVCNNFFNNPVTTLCCGESFCLDCVVERSGARPTLDLNNVYKCPHCNKGLNYADLQVNTSLKQAVDTLVLKKDIDKPSSETAENSTRTNGIHSKSKRPNNGTYVVDVTFLKRQKILAAGYLSKIKHKMASQNEVDTTLQS